ncbi:MAG: hypothetical protein RLW87_07100 [Alphaproteobacteria bacterium]|jgi:hypothetical protein
MAVEDLSAELDNVAETVGDPRLDDCPVVPLGHLEGNYFFFDRAGQLRRMTAASFSENGLIDLFGGAVSWLSAAFPSERKGFRFAKADAAAFLIEACNAAGFLSADQARRGMGVWPVGEFTSDNPRVVLNTGRYCADFDPSEGLFDAAMPIAGRRVGDYVYPVSKDSFPPPARDALSTADAATLFEFIRESWQFEKPELAAACLLGGIGAGFMTGVVPFRPPVLLQAEASSGKSTLMKLVKQLLGPMAVWKDKATAASVQKDIVGDGARPVVLDELEMPSGEDRNARIQELLDVIRSAYTQGQGGYARMGDAGRPLNAYFLAGAIQPPPLPPAEATRIVVLRLKKLGKSADLTGFGDRTAHYAAMGPRLFRRVLDGWARFPETLKAYRRLILPAFPDVPRVADTFGTLFALADIILFDRLRSDADLRQWVDLVDEDAVGVDESDDNASSCWHHLMTSHADNWNSGRRRPFSDFIEHALSNFAMAADDRDVLRMSGIMFTDKDGRVVREHSDVEMTHIAIGRRHQAIVQVFAKTKWRDGGYESALLGLEGAVRSKSSLNFGGGGGADASRREHRFRAVLIPIDTAFPEVSDHYEGEADDPPF